MLIYLPVRKNWKAGYENYRVQEIAEIVHQVVDKENVEIATAPTDDHRSYHISSDKIKWDLVFSPQAYDRRCCTRFG